MGIALENSANTKSDTAEPAVTILESISRLYDDSTFASALMSMMSCPSPTGFSVSQVLNFLPLARAVNLVGSAAMCTTSSDATFAAPKIALNALDSMYTAAEGGGNLGTGASASGDSVGVVNLLIELPLNM